MSGMVNGQIDQPQQDPWRIYLSQLLRSDHDLAKRLAERIGVRPVTIQRWASGETNPHQLFRSLEELARELEEPEQEQFIRCVQQQHPTWHVSYPTVEVSPLKPLPSVFYSKLHQANSQVDDTLAFPTIVALIGQQLSSHLDPDFSDKLDITICLCVPPGPSAFVRSLYIPSQPNARPLMLPWQFPLLIGIESPLAWTLTSHEAVTFDPAELSSLKEAGVQGAAAHVIRRRGKVGGCLVVTSLKRQFTHAQLSIIEEFSTLAVLALEQEHFYPLEHIALQLFPSVADQQELDERFSFRTRMRELRKTESRLSQKALEMSALQHLENYFLHEE